MHFASLFDIELVQIVEPFPNMMIPVSYVVNIVTAAGLVIIQQC